MKKVDFNKLQAGDLVEVPRTQFAPMRSGWNGWLFSEAVVIRKGVGRKSKKNVVVVEMRTPACNAGSYRAGSMGDITIAVITVPLGLMCLFSKKMLIVDNYYFATEERRQ